ncbi:MAG TPA: succinate dehydrogenase, cytochrome b556 subunit [Candidatus Acidoferrales bacterium]
MSLEARLRQRPLSPHLAIYRRTTTMMISFVHRLTGTALYLGTLLLTWCLIAAAEGPKSYPLFESCIGSAAGKFVLFGYSRADSSSSGSLRHFVWDFGQGCALASGAQLGGRRRAFRALGLGRAALMGSYEQICR